MNRDRASASLALVGRFALGVCAVAAVAVSVMSSTVALPIAHADPLGDIRGRVNGARSASTCPPLNYSIDLEGEAQARTGNTLPGVPPTGNYKGTFVTFIGNGDPAETAEIHAEVKADSAIHECSNKDFGVGFFRVNDSDNVAIVLGKPAAPQPVQCPDGSTVPAGQTCPVKPAQVNCPQGSPTPQAASLDQCAPVPPTNCPPGSVSANVPAGQQCGAPTNAVAMSITRDPDVFNADVAITNNSSLPAQCAYTATKSGGLGPQTVKESANVGPNSTATLTDMLWPPLGTTYNAVVNCTVTYNGKQTSIGQASQPVSG